MDGGVVVVVVSAVDGDDDAVDVGLRKDGSSRKLLLPKPLFVSWVCFALGAAVVVIDLFLSLSTEKSKKDGVCLWPDEWYSNPRKILITHAVVCPTGQKRMSLVAVDLSVLYGNIICFGENVSPPKASDAVVQMLTFSLKTIFLAVSFLSSDDD